MEARALLAATILPQPISGPIAADLLALAGTSPDTMTEGLSADYMQFDASGRVAVQISAVDPAALAGPLAGLGASVTAVAQDLHILNAYVPVSQLAALSGLAGQGLLAARSTGMSTSAGSVDAQADQMTEADRVRNVSGLSGAGLTVGVLSDSYNNKGGAAADIASGDLTAPVFLRDNVPASTGVGGADEGRAMMQIVHDVAPGANLAFATAEGGDAVFAQNIRDLAKPVNQGGAGAKVISDDISYYAEPLFQDGAIAQAVDAVAGAGVVYTSSAGNNANNAYENTSPSLTSDPVFTGNGTNFINFGTAGAPTSRQSVRLSNSQALIITLQWDNPFFNAAGDNVNLSIFLVNPTNQAVLAGGNVNTLNSGQPYQLFSFQNTTGAAKNYDILILAAGGAPGRLKWVNYGANQFGPMTINTAAVAGVSTNTAPTMNGHAQSANAIGVGAAAYFNQTAPESFSSFGPTTILFSPDGKTRLASPVVRAKPDVTAIDGVRTTFFPSASSPFFFGTSAAAPNVAGLAALYLQANASATPAQVKSALIASARPMQTNANNPGAAADPNQVGAGLVSIFRALNGTPTPAGFDLAADFDTVNGLNNSWFNSSRFTGQVQVATTVGPVSPLTPPNYLVLDELDHTFAFGAASQADLSVAGAGATNGNDIGISFQSTALGSVASGFGMPATFTTFVNANGVAISADGVSWTRIKDLSGATSGFALSRLNLSAIATSAGIPLTSTFQVRFQGVLLAALPSQGLAFENLRITKLAPNGSGATLASFAGLSTGPVSTLATFSDGASPVGTYTASINWGDGQTTAGSVSVAGNSIVVGTAGHAYATGGSKTYTITLTDTATGRTTTTTGAANVAADITAQAKIASSGLIFSRSNGGFYSGTITVTNTGTSAIAGSALALAFLGLPAGVTLDPSLAGATTDPSGTPYLKINLASPLAAGKSLTVSVRFLTRNPVAVGYTPKLFLLS